MAVQNSLNNSTTPFILGGIAVSVSDAVILGDAGRTEKLVCGTVMAKVAASKKWVPFSDVSAVNGTALAQGIYIGADIEAATIVAGDITDVSILIGEAFLDGQKLIFEGDDINAVIDAGTVNARTVGDQLAYRSLFAQDTLYISKFS